MCLAFSLFSCQKKISFQEDFEATRQSAARLVPTGISADDAQRILKRAGYKPVLIRSADFAEYQGGRLISLQTNLSFILISHEKGFLTGRRWQLAFALDSSGKSVSNIFVSYGLTGF